MLCTVTLNALFDYFLLKKCASQFSAKINSETDLFNVDLHSKHLNEVERCDAK